MLRFILILILFNMITNTLTNSDTFSNTVTDMNINVLTNINIKNIFILIAIVVLMPIYGQMLTLVLILLLI